MKITNNCLSMTTILVSVLALNGCIVTPDNSPRNNNHYQHDNANYHNYTGNNQASGAHFKDLQGTPAISGFDRMAERGFTSVDYMESGNTQYSIYYNRSTRQCIQLTVANNKILSADDIHTHPNCR
jgi:hypothetical protein